MVRFSAAAIALAVTSLGLSAHGQELLLDFWSPQCGPCMQMKPLIQSYEQASYPIQQIDTTRDSEMARKYGVTSIPCLVMLVNGQEVDREVGATSSGRIKQMFDKARTELLRQRGGVRGQSPDPVNNAATAARNTSTGPAPRPEMSATPENPWSQVPANPAAATWPATPLVKPASAVGAPSSVNGDFPPNLMAATVRIRVEGTDGMREIGTGTVIDSRQGEALIVTCGHLFRKSQGKGAMTVEMFEVAGGTPRVAEKLPGQLISYDLHRDVAFVSIRTARAVSAAQVAPTRTPIRQGDRVATIGCSNGHDPTLMPQRITYLDRYQGPANIEVSGAPEEGRSGGGLFNLEGQLIGVCYAADYEGREGLYAALENIHEELDRLKLQDVYAKAAPANQETIIRAQVWENQPITPIPDPASRGSTSTAQNLSDAEKAAFGEVMKRASTSEVMIIVRPKSPDAQSEVIQLDNVSPDFVRAIQEAQRQSTQPTKTR
jgi:thiol-disulfide isomerase/thioredoxin